VGGNPVSYADPLGLTPAGAFIGGRIGWWLGGTAGEAADPLGGGVPGAALGGLAGRAIGDWASNLIFAKPPANAYDPNGPKAPGKPGDAEGFCGPKGGDNWVPNPNGRGNGWQGGNGDVWVPTGPGGSAHGGPHWDVQTPGGGYVNVYPGGSTR